MKIRKLFLKAVFPFLLCAAFLISSCAKDENPVEPVDPPPPPAGPDTVSRYIWKLVPINLTPGDLYAADTNNVYIIGGIWAYSILLFYDGVTCTQYNLSDPDFYPRKVYGFDKNNIFVSGTKRIINSNTYRPVLKKITFGTITNYTIVDTVVSINDLLVTGVNQAWLCEANRGFAYYFDNGTINKYELQGSDSIQPLKFYLSPDNNLFLFAKSQKTTGLFYSYKFENGGFVNVETDCYGDFPCNTNCIFRCGKDVIMTTRNNTCGTKYFNGNEWVYHAFLDSVWAPFMKLGGISKDSLVGLNFNESIYTFGGNKWRKENNSPMFPLTIYESLHNLEFSTGRVYFTFTGEFGSLVIGTPNKK
ncbi:MAG: hypothetical protein HY959_10670 [Ignavibacteriae bacterium]|nr:hypothetical protein [Ignavibacteriota bacterium]